ncbi:MAG: UDP-N-acetylmuramoyl-L-alanine--D-glutamate ligase [Sulfobacillus sp.]
MSAKLPGSRVGLVGWGVSHQALGRHLRTLGCTLSVYDQRKRSDLDARAQLLLDDLAASYIGGPGYLDQVGAADTIFLTPGLPQHLPQIDSWRQRGVRIRGEAEYAISLLGDRVVGITGSSGKSTTSTLTAHLLRAGGVPAVAAGNLGTPLIEVVDSAGNLTVVCELSSFQLGLFAQPMALAAILNVRPNHLDVHPSFEAYLQAKLNLIRNQQADQVALLPAGDEELWRAAAAFAGKKVAIGDPEAAEGAFIRDEQFVVRCAGEERIIARVREWHLIGAHNLQNALFALYLALARGADAKALGLALATFEGLPHRLEVVAEVAGVRFVNDSIATTPDRTVAALAAMQGPVWLLAGGYDKYLDYQPLALARRPQGVFCFGATAAQVAAAFAQADVPVWVGTDLAWAFSQATSRAVSGDTVLLSPASASYDQYSDFKERGQAFMGLVTHYADAH